MMTVSNCGCGGVNEVKLLCVVVVVVVVVIDSGCYVC